MTNDNAASANDTARVKMTRGEMQAETMIIEYLLEAVMAIYSSANPKDAISLVEMAQDRANQLNRALDSVNAPEVGA